jgi:hypothetical protein
MAPKIATSAVIILLHFRYVGTRHPGRWSGSKRIGLGPPPLGTLQGKSPASLICPAVDPAEWFFEGCPRGLVRSEPPIDCDKGEDEANENGRGSRNPYKRGIWPSTTSATSDVDIYFLPAIKTKLCLHTDIVIVWLVIVKIFSTGTGSGKAFGPGSPNRAASLDSPLCSKPRSKSLTIAVLRFPRSSFVLSAFLVFIRQPAGHQTRINIASRWGFKRC